MGFMKKILVITIALIMPMFIYGQTGAAADSDQGGQGEAVRTTA